LKVLEFVANAPTIDLPLASTIDCNLTDLEVRTVTDASVGPI
jgi:hypothetical protein